MSPGELERCLLKTLDSIAEDPSGWGKFVRRALAYTEDGCRGREVRVRVDARNGCRRTFAYSLDYFPESAPDLIESFRSFLWMWSNGDVVCASCGKPNKWRMS